MVGFFQTALSGEEKGRSFVFEEILSTHGNDGNKESKCSGIIHFEYYTLALWLNIISITLVRK